MITCTLKISKCFTLILMFLTAVVEGNTECKDTHIGSGYTGSIAVTLAGYTCQEWSLDTPQDHDYNSETSNYCR